MPSGDATRDLHRTPILNSPTRHDSIPSPPVPIFAPSQVVHTPNASAVNPNRPSEATTPLIPGFEIQSELGRGGMGVVYQARDLALNRVVALKLVLSSRHANPIVLARFRAEAAAAAKLSHPNIVQVYEVGDFEGMPYLTLEFVEGGTLSAQLAVHRVDATTAARLTETLARAISFAHANGVVHRDLKPSNILLTWPNSSEPTSRCLTDCVPKIADFGLAKLLDDDADKLTGTEAILGTPAYMAPEQATGHSREAGPSADVYALGVILYEMLTGQPPFQGSNPMEVMFRVAHEEPLSVTRVRKGVPRDLATICMKCLEKAPSHRYSAAELASDLQRFREDRPIQARRVSAWEHAWRWCRRNPALAGLTGLVSILLLIVAIGSTIAAWQLSWALAESQANLQRALTAESQSRLALGEAKLSEALATTLADLPGQRFRSLQLLREAMEYIGPKAITESDRDRFRNVAVSALVLPDIVTERDWPGFRQGSTENGLAFDGKLRTYALGNGQGQIIVRRVADDHELANLPGNGHPVAVYLSENGRTLVGVQIDILPHPVRVWRLDGEVPRRITEVSADHGCIHVSPDGSKLAYLSQNEVHIRTLETGTEQTFPYQGMAHGRIWAYHWGKQWAAYINRSGANFVAVVVDPTGKRAEFPLDPQHPTACAWHPEGHILAVASHHSIRLFDAVAGQPLGVLEGHKNIDMPMRFDPSGERLFSNDWHGILRVWDWRIGRQLFTIPAFWMGTGPVWFSADGTRLATSGSKFSNLRIMRFEVGRERRTLTHAHPFGNSVLLDPSQQVIGIYGSGLAFIDAKTGLELFLGPTGMTVIRFDEKGRLLTNAAHGIQRWPRSFDATTGQIRFGPPELLRNRSWKDLHSASQDGEVIASPAYNHGVLVKYRNRPWHMFGPQDDVRQTAVSPDGRLIASTSHTCPSGLGLKVWESATGALVREFRVPGGNVLFSPDGQWLANNANNDLKIRRVGDWETELQLGEDAGCFCAFSLDSRLLAIGGNGMVRLMRLPDGKELARLPHRLPGKVWPQAFSVDGGELYASCVESGDVEVWNLRLIREQLRELGLDWDAPALTPQREVSRVPRISVNMVTE